MANLLKKLNAYHTCISCGQKKSKSAFQLISKVGKKPLYDKICKTCRQAELDDDDEGGGGKQLTLKADNDAQIQAKKHQKHAHDLASEAQVNYHEKIDALHNDDLKSKQEAQAKIVNKKRFLDQALDLLKKTSKTLFPTDNQHDPLQQKPVAEHHQILAAHPDRQDVKLLLEYVLSGDYAQGRANSMGISDRHHAAHYAAAGHPVSTAPHTMRSTAFTQTQPSATVKTEVTPQPANITQNKLATNSPIASTLKTALVAVGATTFLTHRAQHPLAPTFANLASPTEFNQSNLAATGFSGEVARDLAVSQRAVASPAYFQFARAETTEEALENTSSEAEAQKIISYMSQTWK